MEAKKVVAREQCPKCLDTGQDNVAVYEDGGKFCYGCHLPVSTSGVVELSPAKPYIEGEVVDLMKTRGITYETCKFFDYRVGKNHLEWVQIANYYNTEGRRCAQKIRFASDPETGKKRFFIAGDGESMPLYGQWKWSPNPKLFVTVVEGEIDALTVAQVQGYQYPVVSVPKGAPDAYKSIKKNLKWLLGFKYVILAFDSDDTGRAATDKCLQLFEPGKVRTAEWPLKDANELLLSGRGKEIKDIIFQAKEHKPENSVTVSDIIDDILVQPQWGISQPWTSLDNLTYGTQFEEIHVIVGANGVGKTEYVKELMFHYLDHGHKLGLFSFEQNPDNTIRRFVGSRLGVKLHIPGSTWNPEQIRAVAMEFDEKIYLYKKAGSASLDELFTTIRYWAIAMGVKVFVIDNLKGLKIANDRERAEEFMTTLQALRKDLKIHILLLSHVAKDKLGKMVYVSTSPKNGDAYHSMSAEQTQGMIDKDGMSWESGRMPSKENVEGQSIVCDLADYVFGIARNTTSQDNQESRTMRIKALKTRLDSSMTGYTFKLYYNDSGRLEELQPPISNRKDTATSQVRKPSDEAF
jgi:twinkle protein